MTDKPTQRWASTPPPRTLRDYLFVIVGPGMAMAATGVGAGDFITAAVNGAKFGLGLLWIIVAGSVVKGLLNEGIARWQLETDTTILEAWCQRFPPFVRYVFIVYLAVWSFFVGGSLSSACGLAAHAILPLPMDEKWSVIVWGAAHLIAGCAFGFVGRYPLFEKIMGALVAVMFVGTIAGAAVTAPNWLQTLKGAFVPTVIPSGSASYIMGTIGGVGGSVSLLCYSYWLVEAKRAGRQWRKATVVDLILCYVLTALFGLGVMIMSAQVFYPSPNITEDRSLLIQLANNLRERVGDVGYWLYVWGFWGAVFSSVLGNAQGIPYLFSHVMAMIKGVPEKDHAQFTKPTSAWYRGYLLFMTFPPLVWLFFTRPVAMVVTFAILASLVTPFITATLLYMNNKREWMGKAKYGVVSNVLLTVSLVLFLYLMATEIKDQLAKLWGGS
jgi:Mn2+/Fe2+ NRAMP family transporter